MIEPNPRIEASRSEIKRLLERRAVLTNELNASKHPNRSLYDLRNDNRPDLAPTFLELDDITLRIEAERQEILSLELGILNQTTKRLEQSSKWLQWLTVGLIALTSILVILTALLAKVIP